MLVFVNVVGVLDPFVLFLVLVKVHVHVTLGLDDLVGNGDTSGHNRLLGGNVDGTQLGFAHEEGLDSEDIASEFGEGDSGVGIDGENSGKNVETFVGNG